VWVVGVAVAAGSERLRGESDREAFMQCVSWCIWSMGALIPQPFPVLTCASVVLPAVLFGKEVKRAPILPCGAAASRSR
jgi:hypothetical protein